MFADSFFYYLVLVGFAAGLMDAAVGGGGLLQIPGLFNLLPNATPVASVMGVNKFASCCGACICRFIFGRKNGGVFPRAIHETGDVGHHDCHVPVHFFEKRLGADSAH